MIKTERKSFDFPIEYLLTKEAVDKAADVFIDKFEELGLIESYWVNTVYTGSARITGIITQV